jgi:hypothetical protein
MSGQNSGWTFIVEREPTSLIIFLGLHRRRITLEQKQFCDDPFFPPHSCCTHHIQQSTGAQWEFNSKPVELYHQVSQPMLPELLLQEHLCLPICSNACTQLLVVSSSRCPSPGHLLLVSTPVEIL